MSDWPALRRHDLRSRWFSCFCFQRSFHDLVCAKGARAALSARGAVVAAARVHIWRVCVCVFVYACMLHAARGGGACGPSQRRRRLAPAGLTRSLLAGWRRARPRRPPRRRLRRPPSSPVGPPAPARATAAGGTWPAAARAGSLASRLRR
eukprot:1697309-Prymnesium_polylepis.1